MVSINELLEQGLSDVKHVILSDMSKYVELLKSFLEGRRELLVTYVGSYSSPARYALLALRSLSDINAYFFRPKELTYYVVPYDEGRELGVIIFASSDGLSELNILVDQVRLTGHDFIVISPEHLPRAIEYKIPKDKLIALGMRSSNVKYWVLAAHILIGRTIPKICRSGVRADRLRSEVSDLEPVLQDLIAHYMSEINDVAKFLTSPVLITSTPTMWGVAEYLALSSDFKSLRLLVSPEYVPRYVKFVNKVLLIETDVEEYSIKEIRGLTLTAATQVKEIKLRTDPLTAPIYGLILARAIEYVSSKVVS